MTDVERAPSPVVQGGILDGGRMLTVVLQDDQAEAAASHPLKQLMPQRAGKG